MVIHVDFPGRAADKADDAPHPYMLQTVRISRAQRVLLAEVAHREGIKTSAALRLILDRYIEQEIELRRDEDGERTDAFGPVASDRTGIAFDVVDEDDDEVAREA